MAYQTIYTNYGLQAIAQAQATGVPVNLTAIAVGDGNGNPTTPNQSQTTLVREVYRHAPNRVYQDASNPLLFNVELAIPYSVGGFTMREIGVFDDTGTLFAVGNTPEAYKPQGDGSEGSYSDTVARVQFIVSNASVITLQVDPNVAVATQQWVNNNITAAALIPGGTTGQILAKQSNADGDVEWKDPTDANVIVDTIEENQTLAASQTVVNLASTITYGLCVFVEGVRLRNDQWTPDPTIGTKLTLAQSYPAGTKISFVNNLPAGSAPQPLIQSRNLSDVASVSTARTNLDVYSKAETDQKAPPGLIGYFARNTAPTGWLKSDGSAVSRTAYAGLFAAIGTTYGSGDGFNTFNLPDLRGEFIRGWDDGRGVDAGRTFGSYQADAFKSHTHDLNGWAGNDDLPDTGITIGSKNNTGTIADAIKATGGTETRPRNRAMLACIKF